MKGWTIHCFFDEVHGRDTFDFSVKAKCRLCGYLIHGMTGNAVSSRDLDGNVFPPDPGIEYERRLHTHMLTYHPDRIPPKVKEVEIPQRGKEVPA